MASKEEEVTAVVDAILAVLESTEFHCPAYKYDEHIGNESVVSDSGSVDWDVLHEPMGPYQGEYDEEGRCKKTLSVEIEVEYGEMGSVLARYPIVCGECATYHGYEYSEGSTYDEIMLRWSERRALLRKVKEVLK